MNKHPLLAIERSSVEFSIENRLKQAERISLSEFLNNTVTFNFNLKFEFSKSCLKQTGSADFEGSWTPIRGLLSVLFATIDSGDSFLTIS